MMSTISAAFSARRAFIARLSTIVLVTAIAATVACGGGGESTTAPKNNEPDLKGVYGLRTIDNATLPQEIYHGPYFDAKNQRFYNQMVVTVIKGQVELLKGDRWTMTLVLGKTLDGVRSNEPFEAQGTYEIDGSDIVFTPETSNISEVTGTIVAGEIGFTLSWYGSNRDKAFDFRR